MNLPNYFLADLPRDATLCAAMISEGCATLKRNRAQYLARRSTDDLVRVLSDVAAGWLLPENRFRKLALELCPTQTGFGPVTMANGLDSFFRQITRENLHALLAQEIGDARRLEGFVSELGKTLPSRAAIVTGPELVAHIVAGTIPNPAFTSMVLGLLLRSAQFVKCASGNSLLPRLFAHSIYEADAKLGACLEIAEWRGGNEALEVALFAQADCVSATGSDETLAAIRAKLPVKTRFVGHGHRLSFGYVSRELLFDQNVQPVVANAATDIVAWNQLGCLSPHVIYVQTGGEVTPRQFAALLAEELERCEAREPRGDVPVDIAAAIASRRAVYEVRAAHSQATQLWRSQPSTAWTVVFEEDARFQISCLNRFIYVKPVGNLSEALENAVVVREHVSTVGLAASPREAQSLALQLARWGVTRVCPLGQMQHPPLTWRHDGRPALGDLVTWTDFEQ
jgi:hypothetical protein